MRTPIFFCWILCTWQIFSQASEIIHLEGCQYSMDLYREYLNLLESSNDSHLLHIQAIYSFSSKTTLIPGHIYTSSFQSVALIPLFIRCQSPEKIVWKSYLPFTQCSATITNRIERKNYESTRTYLTLKNLLSLTNVPVLYTGEYNLILSNCSFRYQSNIYQLKSNEIFQFRIEYEKSITDNLTSCQTCNSRTSICEDKQCICRKGTIPLKLHENREFCVDTTSNCSFDPQRCLNSLTTQSSNLFLYILIACITCLFIILLVLLWCLFRKRSRHILTKDSDLSSNPSIFTIDRHERTPSTISTTDSIKFNDRHLQLDQHILANEYVSTFYEEYPKIISDRNNADLVLILA